MAKNKDISIDVSMDKQLVDWCTKLAPQRLEKARKDAVVAMGMAWADEAKSITREDNHIDTGLYVNSIGYATGSPNSPLYELEETRDKAELNIGADISYARHLEKRYNIFVRGLDRAEPRMQKVAEFQIKKAFEL